MDAHPKRITILNTPVDVVTMAETLTLIVETLSRSSAKCAQICTTNPEFVMAAQNNPQFLTVLSEALLCIPDGIGLIYASYLKGGPLKERVAGSDLVYRVAELAAGQNRSLFLLGSAEGVAAEAARILQQSYPELKIAGTFAGSPAQEERDSILAMINRSEADILYVAYGAPQQDIWIFEALDHFDTVKVAIGIGGSLDFMTGRSTRAPKWVQQIGFEWLHRLIKEPWRWRRMLVLPRFAWQVLLER
ncbi:MAG: WecB/TagA/CpsF family glycosyltransferase [Chloroflexota bacterium]